MRQREPRLVGQAGVVASGAAVLDPTVFTFAGKRVTSAADVTDDDQAGFEQMKKLFPTSLWTSAYQSLGSASKVRRIDQCAETVGGCGHS